MKKKLLAGLLAGALVLGSAMTAFAATKETVECTGWWTAWTKGYEIKDGQTLEFDIDQKSVGKFTETRDEVQHTYTPAWHCVTAAFANVATPGGKGDEVKPNNVEGYKEYVVLRADNYGWMADDDVARTKFLASTTYTTEEFLFLGDLVDHEKALTNAHYDVTVSRTGDTLKYDFVITKGDGSGTVKGGYEVKNLDMSSGCYVFFTSETGVTFECTLVEAAADSTTPPATGDSSSIALFAGVAALAAGAILVSKKRTVEEM